MDVTGRAERDGDREGLGPLPKAATGIEGLDQLTQGGLPRGRPTLICGSAGCGKTMMAMEFLVRGATEYGEPGVFMAFEEVADELVQNAKSLGFDVGALMAEGRIAIDHVHVDRSELEATGEYDLEALFIRLGYAIDSIGAKRVVLDTIEALFAAFPNEFVVRAELRRLFRWLKDRGVTAVITAERGDGTLTRHGLEEYVSDCVIVLDHRLVDQVSTRRLRVVKYRGTGHGTNEYPFLISDTGFSVLPITSIALQHVASDERVSSGVAGLDEMLGGQGFFRGTTVLVSGTAGTGKTSLAAHFVHAACRRGERALYFAFEESIGQMVRNMRSIGVDLQPWLDSGQLRFDASRPTAYGLEMHLALLFKAVNEFRPSVVVVDPITNFLAIGSTVEVKAMLLRIVDHLKSLGTTALFTNLTSGGAAQEATDIGLSSIIDTWLLVRELEQQGERNRGLYVLKSRGMAHSNQVREFLFTDHGIELVDVVVGPNGILTGSQRAAFAAQLRSQAVEREAALGRRRAALERKRQAVETQIAHLLAEITAEEEAIGRDATSEATQESVLAAERASLARMRQGARGGPQLTQGAK